MHFLWFLREDWGDFQNSMYVEGKGEERIEGRNVIKMALKWKSKWVSTSLISTIEVLQGLEEVELSDTHTAYIMHIPNTLSLISARNNRKLKFQ